MDLVDDLPPGPEFTDDEELQFGLMLQRKLFPESFKTLAHIMRPANLAVSDVLALVLLRTVPSEDDEFVTDMVDLVARMDKYDDKLYKAMKEDAQSVDC